MVRLPMLSAHLADYYGAVKQLYAALTAEVSGADEELTLETVLWAAANFISCAPDQRPPEQREVVLKGLGWAIEQLADAYRDPEVSGASPSPWHKPLELRFDDLPLGRCSIWDAKGYSLVMDVRRDIAEGLIAAVSGSAEGEPTLEDLALQAAEWLERDHDLPPSSDRQSKAIAFALRERIKRSLPASPADSEGGK